MGNEGVHNTSVVLRGQLWKGLRRTVNANNQFCTPNAVNQRRDLNLGSHSSVFYLTFADLKCLPKVQHQ